MIEITIIDGKKYVGRVTDRQIIDMMGGEANATDRMRRDMESIMSCIKKYGVEDRGLTLDMHTLLENSTLDAEKTSTVFWLAAVLGSSGLMSRLSPVTAIRMIPLINAKTKAAELSSRSSGKDMETLLKFSRTYIGYSQKLATGECSSDEACEALYKALPPERLVRSEVKERPEIIDILDSVRKLGAACADSDITRKYDEYFENISDIFERNDNNGR